MGNTPALQNRVQVQPHNHKRNVGRENTPDHPPPPPNPTQENHEHTTTPRNNHPTSHHTPRPTRHPPIRKSPPPHPTQRKQPHQRTPLPHPHPPRQLGRQTPNQNLNHLMGRSMGMVMVPLALRRPRHQTHRRPPTLAPRQPRLGRKPLASHERIHQRTTIRPHNPPTSPRPQPHKHRAHMPNLRNPTPTPNHRQRHRRQLHLPQLPKRIHPTRTRTTHTTTPRKRRRRTRPRHNSPPTRNQQIHTPILDPTRQPHRTQRKNQPRPNTPTPRNTANKVDINNKPCNAKKRTTVPARPTNRGGHKHTRGPNPHHPQQNHPTPKHKGGPTTTGATTNRRGTKPWGPPHTRHPTPTDAQPEDGAKKSDHTADNATNTPTPHAGSADNQSTTQSQTDNPKHGPPTTSSPWPPIPNSQKTQQTYEQATSTATKADATSPPTSSDSETNPETGNTQKGKGVQITKKKSAGPQRPAVILSPLGFSRGHV